MIRSSQSSQSVYREVLKHALQTSWQDRRYWILAILAGILMTAGSYDVIWQAFNAIITQGPFLSLRVGETVLSVIGQYEATTFDTVISVIGGVETLLFFAFVLLTVLVISVVAQGALVYALGARKRGHTPTLSEALSVGGRAFWPVAVLNALAFAFVWILRFLAALPLNMALSYTTSATYLLYLASFAVFVPLMFLVCIIQVFALNAMILQGSTLGAAVRRGYLIFKRHWLVVVETAAIQAALSVGLWLAYLFALTLLFLPAFMMLVTAAVIQSSALMSGVMIVGSLVLVTTFAAAAGFTLQLQYATWTYMYRRLGEGGVVPKIHRIVRGVMGWFTVPQS